MDAFFAAVEQRDRPELKGKPVVVGGDPHGRGVVSTASYEARAFGIRSAMPAAQARRLCPQAVFLKPDFEKYRKASGTVMGILAQHTELLEAVSIDEAYLDVTEHKLGIKDPVMVAALIRQNIRAVTRLSASAGVAPNLFLAKVASDFKKPDGLTVIRPEEVASFLKDLPVRKIPGVGPVTEEALHKLGLRTSSDLAGAGAKFLQKQFGKTGLFLYERALGRDDREVEPHTPSKQYSCEETFPYDIKDKAVLKKWIAEFSAEVYHGLRREGRMGKTIVLKVKYFDFEQITRSQTLSRRPKSPEDVFDVAAGLLDQKTQAGRKPVRLIGVGISGLEDLSETPAQKELFDFS